MTNKLDLKLTPFFDDFISYYRKAERLQDQCVLGNAAYTDVGVDDATQVVSNLFKSRKDSEFTGNVDKVTITIPDSE